MRFQARRDLGWNREVLARIGKWESELGVMGGGSWQEKGRLGVNGIERMAVGERNGK